MSKTLKIFFHDACFDGTASAALFAAFYRDAVDRAAEVVPIGMVHADGDPFVDTAFDADDHACVDFRYTDRPQLRWWFDHHRTAFQPERLRAAFERDASGAKFWSPDAPSCAGFMTRTLGERWGWRPPAHLLELVRWADTIDAARFGSAAEAVATERPAQRLALWISHNRDRAAAARYIELLTRAPLEEVAADPAISAAVSGLVAGRAALAELVERRAVVDGDVVLIDLADDPAGPSPGFLGYQLFPACRYSVSLVRGEHTVKVAVGRNPWTTRAAAAAGHDVGALCAAHGGGGHHAVGGITLPLHEVGRARTAARAILGTLRGD
ncbi:MAG: phosphoesterase [Kofleriaceae bacterium]|nr:phosphoesterase [Kofleriaceae bacterium]MBP6840515.1 phosphoesterase [Kofleriaceae bacterium]